MSHPYRDSQAEERITEVDGKTVTDTTFEIDDIEATITWEDPANGEQQAVKAYPGDKEPVPDYPGGICCQQFRYSPNLYNGDNYLSNELAVAAANNLLQIDKDTYVPWHRVMNVKVTKRTTRAFVVRWVPYQYGNK